MRLLAVPDGGYEFSGWTLTGGLSCEGGLLGDLACDLDVDLAAAAAGSPSVAAAFAAVPATLTLSVSGPAAAGGVARADFGGGSAQGEARHGEGFTTATAVTALPGVTLTAVAGPGTGYGFSAWTLSTGLSCADGLEASPCVLEAPDLDAADADASATAAFAAVATTLTVSAGANGSVTVAVEGAGGSGGMVLTGKSGTFAFDVESTATLTAEAADGHRLDIWTLSPDTLSCAAEEPVCVLPAGTAGPVAATATFAAVPATLTVSVSGPEGAGASVAVVFGDGSAQGEARHGADFSAPTVVTALAGVMLAAAAAAGYEFSGWRLSDGLSCAGATTEDPACMLAVADLDALADPATAEAAFELMATTLTVSAGANGRVTVAVRGVAAEAVEAGGFQEYPFDVESTATLTAEAADGHRLDIWTLSPDTLSCAAEEPVCVLPAGTAGPGGRHGHLRGRPGHPDGQRLRPRGGWRLGGGRLRRRLRARRGPPRRGLLGAHRRSRRWPASCWRPRRAAEPATSSPVGGCRTGLSCADATTGGQPLRAGGPRPGRRSPPTPRPPPPSRPSPPP